MLSNFLKLLIGVVDSISRAWNLSFASYNGVVAYPSFSVTGTPLDIFFRADGLKMYIINTGRLVHEHDLSTAWSVATASFVRSFNLGTRELSVTGIFFSPDGVRMYVIGSSRDRVNEYTLSTAWDISTALFIRFFSVAAQETIPTGVFFRDDGLKMYVVGSTGDDVNEYTLSTAWNLFTASFVRVFSVAAQETNPQDIFFRPDGQKMYVTGPKAIYQYDIE
jgi:DNA-binding beta-propeller fold protein YncE